MKQFCWSCHVLKYLSKSVFFDGLFNGCLHMLHQSFLDRDIWSWSIIKPTIFHYRNVPFNTAAVATIEHEHFCVSPIQKQVCFQLHAHIAFWLPNLHVDFFNDACIHRSLKCRIKECYKMVFDLNMLKTHSVYLFNQIFIWVYFWFVNIKKRYDPYVCLCISSYTIDEKIVHCCFKSIK